METSKKFVVVSFFAAITLSALCNSIFNIFAQVSTSQESYYLFALFYPVSLLMFLIKYFIDDVVVDFQDDSERITRSSLTFLVIAWTLFLLSALSSMNTFTSSIFWIIGLIAVTVFLLKNRKPVGHAKCYLIENLVLILVLGLVTSASFSNSLISSLSQNAPAVIRYSCFARTMIIILLVLNLIFFVTMCCDK